MGYNVQGGSSIVYKTVSVDQKLLPQKGPEQCQLPEREKEINYKKILNLMILFHIYISHEIQWPLFSGMHGYPCFVGCMDIGHLPGPNSHYV